MRLRSMVVLAIAVAPSSPVVADTPRFASARDLAAAMLEPLEVEPRECDPTLEVELGPDLEVFCGRGSGSLGSFKKAWSRVLEDPVFRDYAWLAVSKWHAADGSWMRVCYWLGTGSIEGWFDNKTSEVRWIASKPYPRCGPDTPFRPPGMGETKNSLISSLVPTGYPMDAAKDKLDGSVALEIAHVDGKPSVMCIHHATPQGLGFEFFAIEAVHTTVDLAFVEPENPDEHGTVLLTFSKADERPRPAPVDYH